MRLIILIWCTFFMAPVGISSTLPSASLGTKNQSSAQWQCNAEDPASEYVAELKKFVSSVKNEKFRHKKYWQEMDKLWEALQLRKENLQGQFTKAQRKQIRKLERRYRRMQYKGTRAS